jgi:thymidylate synthase (FAD)
MKVIPIASTVLHTHAVNTETPYRLHGWHDPVTQSIPKGETDIDELFELAGRNCYKSWHRPSQKTATNEGYLSNIISQQHFSVMEHGSVTFYVEGVSRSLLAELSRHRHLSFSVVSQRYVDANDLDVVYPPIIDELDGDAWSDAVYQLGEARDVARMIYDNLVTIFTDAGYKRKQAREAARAVLPNMMDSPMVVTGNIRAWRDVLSKRYHIAADREIQQFAEEVLKHLRVLAPNSVQDIEGKYGS